MTDEENLPPWHVVWVHGFLGGPGDWDGVEQGLDLDVTTSRVTLPGHDETSENLSPKAILNLAIRRIADAVNDAEPDRRVALAGYSMGGRLALHAVGSGVVSPSALILISASPGIDDERERKARRARDDAWATRMTDGTWPEFLQAWYRQPVFADLIEDPERLAAMVQRRLPMAERAGSLARVITAFSPGALPTMWRRIGRLPFPLLYVVGENDPAYVDALHRVERLSRTVQTITVPGAGHALPLVAPAALAEAIHEFLRRN